MGEENKNETLDQAQLDAMLAGAGAAPASPVSPASTPAAAAAPAQKVEIADFSFGAIAQGGESGKIDMILDVSIQISVELGRTRMPIKDLLNLVPGSVVELDKLAGDPLDIFVNDTLVAKGKVVVVDENFGIRITDLVSAEERIKSLR